MDEQEFRPDQWTATMIERHGRTHAFEERGEESLTEWQRKLRRDLETALGFPVIEEEGVSPLDGRRLSVEELPDHTREKWIVDTEADFTVPFYLLLPRAVDPPYPVVLTIHGHRNNGKELYVGRVETDEQRELITEGEHDVAAQAVERGYAAIAPDVRAFGELSNRADQEAGRGYCQTLQMHAQLFGRTLVGDRVWDVTRLADFVEEHDSLDADRMAITGNSGGGTVTLFAAAIDQRFSLAAPASYFGTFEDSIASINHCVCNYVPGAARLGEMWDIAGLIAPRPFIAIAGAEDRIFPIEGVRRGFERLQPIYRAAGAPERCDLYVGPAGHRYYEDGAWPFIERYL